MIYHGTKLRVIDNSGARFALCIKVLRKKPTCRARLGDTVTIVVKEHTPGKKVGKGDICKAIIVRDSKYKVRKEGAALRFINSACVLVKKDGTVLAKRILGPVSKELRNMGHLKIISLSSLAL